MIDYENDIVFKPELTWEELCEWLGSKATKLIEKGESLSRYSDDFFLINSIFFGKNKKILTAGREYIAENVSYDRMKTIIQALYEE
jgi:hypothetical protein